MKTAPEKKSAELFERARTISPGGVHSPVRGFRGVGGTPRFIESAAGAELKDVDGNRYVDFCMSWGPLLFGHGDPEIAEAVQKAIARGWSYGTAEPYSLELAEFITSRIPWVQKIRFVNSGTEAVMSAIRLARGATGRPYILKFDGCYHGHADSMLVRAGSGLAEMASPDSAGVSPATAAETLVVPLDDLNAYLAMLDAHAGKIAAVIIEPLPANNGLLIQRKEFLLAVAEHAKKAGILLILDEVISGFRVAFGGMAEVLGITPDLVTYGKVIGGGFPVGAYGGRSELMDLIAPSGPVYQAGTLSANPVAMSAGLAMVKKIDRLKPFEELAKRTRSLAEGLTKSLENGTPVELSVQYEHSLFWLVFGRNSRELIRRQDHIPAVSKPEFARLFHGLLARGYYLAPSGFEVGFLSTQHTDAHIAGLISAVKDFYSELKDQ